MVGILNYFAMGFFGHPRKDASKEGFKDPEGLLKEARKKHLVQILFDIYNVWM
jgi:hypothetical protein